MDRIELISEQIEREALLSLHEHCPEVAGNNLGLELHEVSDAAVAIARNDPSVVLNRTLGLGFTEPAGPGALGRITDIYRSAGVGRFFIHLYPEALTDPVEREMEKLRLVKSRGWMKFHRDDSPPPEAPTDLRVEEVSGREHARHFGRIVANAFGMTDAAIPLLAGLDCDPHWYIFLSFDGDTPAGAGAMYAHGDSAWMEWGATDSSFRRRGSQAAVMAARIKKALELGCRHIFTETGEAVEGDPQHSYKNILKAGFTESRLRLNYTLKTD